MNIICPGVVILIFILYDILWDSWICALVSDINLGKIVILLSNIASVTFFFLLLLFPERNVYYIFCSYPKVLKYFVLLLLFYLLFSWRISIFFTSSSSEILSLAMSSLLKSPSKAVFISVTVVYISSTFFGSFFEFPSLCLHCLSSLFFSWGVGFHTKFSMQTSGCFTLTLMGGLKDGLVFIF